jgi:hypothetical protein
MGVLAMIGGVIGGISGLLLVPPLAWLAAVLGFATGALIGYGLREV